MARLGGKSTELLQISPDERARAARSAALFSEEDLTRFLDVMLRTFDQLNYRQEQRFHLELGLLKLVHLQRLLPVEQLLSQLPVAGKTASSGGALPGGGSAKTTPARTLAGSTSASAPAIASPPRTAAEVQPVAAPFSPFETDRSRKLEEPAVTTESRASAQTQRPAPSLRTPTPWEAASQATSVAVAPRIQSAKVDQATEVEAPQSSAIASALDLDLMRDAVCSALDAGGHNTAAALLSSGAWAEADGKIRVEVAIKKTMLGLTMNAEAEKIVKTAAREAGFSGAIAVVSAANGSEEMNGASAPAKRPAAAGSLQAEALAHPLVKQALELFNGEVRSVLDLREKRNA